MDAKNSPIWFISMFTDTTKRISSDEEMCFIEGSSNRDIPFHLKMLYKKIGINKSSVINGWTLRPLNTVLSSLKEKQEKKEKQEALLMFKYEGEFPNMKTKSVMFVNEDGGKYMMNGKYVSFEEF